MKVSYKTELFKEDELERAAELLKQGEIVSFPTETVYGLGACIFLPQAIEKIFIAKGRPSDNPLIAHINHFSQVEQIAKNIPEDFYLLYKAFFPGPLTVVLEKTDAVPSIVSAGLPSIAFRMPAHPIALKLIELVGQPLVAPSANLSGKPSSTDYKHVQHDFEGKIAAIVQGSSSEIGIESTVISLLGEKPVILRPGHITKEQIEKILGKEVGLAKMSKEHSGPVMSPGMKYRHYAPEAKVLLFYSLKEVEDHLEKSAFLAKRLFLSSSEPIKHIKDCAYFPLSAKTLYAALRHADAEKVSEVLVLVDGDILHNSALMNRLVKAAENT